MTRLITFCDQFIGALMWLPAEKALPLMKLVPGNAIWQPVAQWAYELIEHVLAQGGEPTPVAVRAAGRHRSAHDAIDPDQPPSARQHHQLALYLFGEGFGVWRLDDANDMWAQIALGVDGIITNYPASLRTVRTELGMPLPSAYQR
jgi:glycerophosphoryl diester phosphodiesterase